MRTYKLRTETIGPGNSYPSRTYALKEDSVEGMTDGIEAVKQAVDKILQTERFEYPIYSFSYGAEIKKMIGRDEPYVRAELQRILTESLMRDDRIKEVYDFVYSFQGDVCRVHFTIKSIFGEITAEKEVTV